MSADHGTHYNLPDFLLFRKRWCRQPGDQYLCGNQNNFQDIASHTFFDLIHLGFAARRKQLLGNLSKQYDRDLLTNIFSTVDLPLDVRGEDVHLNKWLLLAKEIEIHS